MENCSEGKRATDAAESNESVETFVSKSCEYDLTLTVEGKKVYVSRVVLSVASPVFRAMFKSNFKEKDQKEVELPGKKYEDFVEFLYCFYPDRLKHITAANVNRILPYVVEYQVKVLEEICEELMIHILLEKHTTNAKEVYRHLQLSETYSLKDLKNKCISVASELFVAAMDEGSSAYNVSDNSVLQIRYLALKRKELNQKDDLDILGMYASSSNNPQKVRDIARSRLLNVAENSDCKDLLRALRLCLRYFQNDEEQLKITKFLNIKPHDTLESVKDELDLLPEKVKQSLKIYKT